jgi:hypothetical protein
VDGTLSKAAWKMGLRIFLALPIAPVIIILFASIFGIPLGLGLGMVVGAWITKPIREHPEFNVEGDAE